MKTIGWYPSQRTGALRPLNAVNNGPVGTDESGASGNFAAFCKANIPFVRNHDAAFYTYYGGEFTVDVHRIFRDFDADENDPASYKFSSTDKYIAAIQKTGGETFYRLGAAIEHYEKRGTYPPKDFDKWARVCEHIVRHYNEGWANGFRYGIRYWEIWNEADGISVTGDRPNWQGTNEEFFVLFEKTAKHLKSCFPDLCIGGPAVSDSIGADIFLEKFFPYLKETKTPLDFFSWHLYLRDPKALSALQKKYRAMLDAYGFEKTPSFCDEWNYVKDWSGEAWKESLAAEKSLLACPFIVACMAEAQTSGMDMLMYYDARPCGMNGLFATDDFALLKGYYAIYSYGQMYKYGSVTKVDYEDDLYAVGAANENGGALLLARYTDEGGEAEEIAVKIEDLPFGKYTVSVKVVDEERDLEELLRMTAESRDLTLTLKAGPLTTYYIEIEQE